MKEVIDKISKRYQEDIIKGVKILKEAGCKEVFLFGSLSKGEERAGSDIDLAIRGCPTGMYFHILGKLMFELEHPVDLINLDGQDDFAKRIEKRGELIYVS
ncbi:MAG: nucleotidyltransferase domain-containing protein [Firmicutes bacterium HGW-Firmicutes-12]|jgi:predicted nucleotidyltransferase|nr:MAG: nucleotidyltransferase domain-containing protein [Firmicutes bacterium HGW-Firmicutes-12]